MIKLQKMLNRLELEFRQKMKVVRDKKYAKMTAAREVSSMRIL